MGWPNIGRTQTVQTRTSTIGPRETAQVSLRMPVANKIATALIDRINAEIIRPGPKPEERECYVVAQELRDLTPQLAQLVVQILKEEETGSKGG
jgi:hypothetical protein